MAIREEDSSSVLMVLWRSRLRVLGRKAQQQRVCCTSKAEGGAGGQEGRAKRRGPVISAEAGCKAAWSWPLPTLPAPSALSMQAGAGCRRWGISATCLHGDLVCGGRQRAEPGG